MRIVRGRAGARRSSARGWVLATVGLAAIWSGGVPASAVAATAVWGTPTLIAGPPGGLGELDGVSCVGVGSCTAVGMDANERPIHVTESGGVWDMPTEIPGMPEGSRLNSVSCVGVGDCTAVGANGNVQPFYVSESGGVWGPATEIPGAPGGPGDLYGVSCVDASNCTAVGYDGNMQPIHVSESGGTWGPLVEITGTVEVAAFSAR